MKKNIAVLAGGYSSEREVSLWSADNVINALDKTKYEVFLIRIDYDEWYMELEEVKYLIDKNDFSINIDEKKILFDYAFIVIHGTPAEDGLLQGYFDLMNIPYSASGVWSSSLSFNKFAYNHFVKSFGVVNIAKSILIGKTETIDVKKIIEKTGLPCFVKPNQQGSSFGIAKVATEDELVPAIEKALEQDDFVIIEEFLQGVEVTNGVMKIGDDITALPITEVVSKNELFDFQAKYNPNLADEITPARISETLTKRIQDITKRIYELSGFKGIVRIDYIICNEDIYMLEANTIPGMTSNSFIPKQLEYLGKSVTETLTELIG